MAFLEYRPTQTVYKYCSPTGFLGITKSKRLWFSDLSSVNDPREIKLGYEHFIDALKFVRQEALPGERGTFLSILADRLTGYRERARAYCCCFSLAADELPMWSAYGEKYGGLALGFRPTALFSIPARVQRVKYLDQNTPNDFQRLVREIAATFGATPKPDDLNFWVSTVASAFAEMTALKHNTWAYEREVRLVHARRLNPPQKDEHEIFSITDYLPNGEPVKWTKPLERATSLGNVHYLEFPFGLFRDGVFRHERAIEKVILGPKCPLTPSEVNVSLEENGFENFEIVKSACEIR